MPHTRPPTDDDDAGDELDINLRAPAIVASRAIVLSAVCRRAHLELAPDDLGADDPEGDRFDLAAWIADEGLDPVLTPAEQRLLKTRVGKLPRADALAASWQIEGLAALAWALALLDDPPLYYDPIESAALLALIPAPWSSTKSLRTAAALRREVEIANERERAELWNWRAETAASMTGASPHDHRNLRALVREVAEEARTAGLLASLVRHDFAVVGRPYRDLDADALEPLAIIAAERLRALNWLCGFGIDWDHVPLEV